MGASEAQNNPVPWPVMERLFSVDEANDLLETIEPMVRRLVALEAEMQSPPAVAARAAVGSNGGGHAVAAVASSGEARIRLLSEIEDLGVVMRDPATGLIDFPAERDGVEVHLCWKLGEDSVAHWHPQDGGFAGRQPL
jgi:hypothetical protein